MIVMRVLRVWQEMEKEKKWVYLELGQSGESEKEQSFMLRSEVGWGGFLCALFEAEVLTEGP